ncbi:MAG TPA: SpoIIE family protein phosphatase [Terracidiphilus sp.]
MTKLCTVCFLAMLCVLLPAQAAPSAQAAPQIVQPAAQPAPLPAVLSLDGPWRFQIGDDPRWSDPALDDAQWVALVLSQPITKQGISAYSGFAWYRLHLTQQQLAPAGVRAQSLLVMPNSVGQLTVFVNGVQSGSTPGMASDKLFMVESSPFLVPLPPSGPVVIAVRSWAGPDVTIGRGLMTEAEAGPSTLLAEHMTLAVDHQWSQGAIADAILGFLFLALSGFGFTLFLAQRNHSEYLWLVFLGLSVAVSALSEAAYNLGAYSLEAFRIFGGFSGHIFMAITLEFVLRFTQSPMRRAVRAVQVAVLILPFLGLLPTPLSRGVLGVAAEIVFVTLVCVMLFRAWRSGRTDAGVMFVPFLLASTADSIDTLLNFLASHGWIPVEYAALRFHLGPVVFGVGAISYSVFLASLVAVILYRFIRVSQLEQRSSAEISAARSVQALLIPTELPSNQHFMLESAYLPVHGVGGDFFQVLPLPDDSLLIVVGDVSGKGLQAAMNSSTLVGALRNELSHDPAIILKHLNRVLIGAVASPSQIAELDAAPCFATCLCARIHTDGTLHIANAGHLSPYRDGRELPLPPGLPLGVVAGAEYEQVSFQLNRGDRLVFLSDGVVEATNAQGELFGFERTQQVANESARYIAATAKHFGQTDDITVVSLYLASRTAHTSEAEAIESAHS